VARLITSQDIGEFLASANKSIGRDRLDIPPLEKIVESDPVVENGESAIRNVVVINQTDYNNISEPDPNTVYLIKE
jgi:hypothetical protein